MAASPRVVFAGRHRSARLKQTMNAGTAVEKLSVAITPTIADAVRKVVDDGEYASTSEVVREALEEWSIRRTQRRLAKDEIGRLWDEGRSSGAPTDGPEAFARIRARLDADIEAQHGR